MLKIKWTFRTKAVYKSKRKNRVFPKFSEYSEPDKALEFSMISPQYMNANIANFVLPVPFKIKKTNKVWSLER